MQLEAQNIALKKAKEDKKAGKNQYVVFNIAQEEYGVEISYTREIIKSPQITRVPNSAQHIIGVINLRGIIVPVVNLHDRLDISEENLDFAEDEERIITIEINDLTLGLRVDYIEGIVWLDENKITEPPESSDGPRRDFLKGVCPRNENHLLILLDLEKTLMYGGVNFAD